jgi:tRNA pseudouridine55 synthase
MTRATVAPPERELRMAEGEMLLVDKPQGWSSFDVVNRIRHLFHVPRVGHAGTLDPMATGLLIVCSGKRTRELGRFGDLEKEYEGEMRLGARTESYDAETPVVEERTTDGITEERVREVLARFVGIQEQLPPMWSAVKVKGRPLYKYARKGVEVNRPPRTIEISSLTARRIQIPLVEFSVVCSKGTYVRTLAHDLGEALGCGAYLSGLRRTRIGSYHVEDAVTMEELVAIARQKGGAS